LPQITLLFPPRYTLLSQQLGGNSIKESTPPQGAVTIRSEPNGAKQQQLLHELLVAL